MYTPLHPSVTIYDDLSITIGSFFYYHILLLPYNDFSITIFSVTISLCYYVTNLLPLVSLIYYHTYEQHNSHIVRTI